jgi:hypothetical protein
LLPKNQLPDTGNIHLQDGLLSLPSLAGRALGWRSGIFSILWLLACLPLLITSLPAYAQNQCGTVSSIAFPVDRSTFQLAQDFGVPSPRHQGRYHTGEDWTAPRGSAYGQPVRAIADGRVTYSAATGWGRDGGVVIIEHTFPDGSTYYSQYGHMESNETYPFPERYTCVKGGGIIGAVGNARPAPHLHLEIRTNQPDLTGPGYTSEFPTLLGWRKPSQFILNWSAWMSPAHRWHVEGNDLVAPPLVFAQDYSFMVLEKNRLRGVTPTGGVLWRINLDKPAVGLSRQAESALVTFADGTMQVVAPGGTPGEQWATGLTLESPAIASGDTLFFHTPDNALVRLTADHQAVEWRLEGVPPVLSSYVAPNLLGLLTDSHEIWSVSHEGQVLDRAQLDESAGLSSTPNGELLVYSAGGLWAVDRVGTWSLVREDAPPGGASSAALLLLDGRLFLLTRCRDVACLNPAENTTALLFAYNPDGSPAWTVDVGDIGGQVTLSSLGNVLLLTSTDGHILALQAESGGLCNAVQIYGDRRSLAWHELGADGVLRIALGNQVMGLDWRTFLGGCAP